MCARAKERKGREGEGEGGREGGGREGGGGGQLTYHGGAHTAPGSGRVTHHAERLVAKVTPAKVVEHAEERRRRLRSREQSVWKFRVNGCST